MHKHTLYIFSFCQIDLKRDILNGNGSKLHEDKIARGDKIVPRVIFAREFSIYIYKLIIN